MRKERKPIRLSYDKKMNNKLEIIASKNGSCNSNMKSPIQMQTDNKHYLHLFHASVLSISVLGLRAEWQRKNSSGAYDGGRYLVIGKDPDAMGSA